MKLFSLVVLLCALPLSTPAFADSIDLTPAHWLPVGGYGGGQASLNVQPRSAELDLPCAVGKLNRPVLTAAGFFRMEGTYSSRMITNPPRPGLPATFSGRLVGQSLWIQVDVHGRGNNQRFSFGPLNFGQQGRFFRCL